MKSRAPILSCAAILLLHLSPCSAQEILSFEPGGYTACSKAIHIPIPGNDSSGIEQKSFGYQCAERDLAIEKKRFDLVRKSLDTHSREERVAYNALVASFNAFLDAHLATEGCKGGIGCGVINEQDKAVMNYDFLVMVEGFVKDGFPSFTENDLSREDALLNTTYEAVIASLPSSCTTPDPVFGCVSRSDMRDTERAWLRYRDAWVTFGALRWPEITSTTWKTWLTRQRTRQFQGE